MADRAPVRHAERTYSGGSEEKEAREGTEGRGLGIRNVSGLMVEAHSLVLSKNLVLATETSEVKFEIIKLFRFLLSSL